MVGIGPTEEKQVTTTNTYTTSREITVGETLKGKAWMCAVQQNTTYTFFQDLIWNSLLVYPETTSFAYRRVRGIAMWQGKILSNERIALSVGGKQYVTFSDSQGNYSFSAADIPSGKALLSIRNVSQNVSIQQAPIQQAPIQKAPIQQAPIQKAPIQQAPTLQAPLQPTLIPKKL
jgi:hypothetical protein